MPVGIKRRKLEYGDITGLNVLEIMTDRSHMHVWSEEIGGRTLIVGYMFPDEVPGVRVAPPEQEKIDRKAEKKSDGGLFTTTIREARDGDSTQ